MNSWAFLKEVLLFYVYLTAGLYVVSLWMIFQPPKPSYQDSDGIIKITSSFGNKISAIYKQHPEAEYTILYSHGNAEDLGNVVYMLEYLRDLGFNVLGYDYQGYGTSEGLLPTEGRTYDDITAAYHYLISEKNIPAEKIIVFGMSVGTGPSVYLAQHQPVKALILQAPFVSAARVLTRVPLFPVDRYKNLSRLKSCNMPLLVIHGEQDRVIPFWHGEKIYKSYQHKKQFFPVAGADHNDLLLVAKNSYKETIINFVEQLP